MDSGIMSDMYLRLWRVTCAVKPVWRRLGREVMKCFRSVAVQVLSCRTTRDYKSCTLPPRVLTLQHTAIVMCMFFNAERLANQLSERNSNMAWG